MISSIVIDVVEQLYFDIRPALQAPGFIAAIVIRAEADKGFDDTAAYMRMAYFGGPYAARALVEARTRLPADQSEQLLDASLLLHAKFQQAIDMELSPAQAMQFLTLAAEIRRDEARILLERDKLSFRRERWSQRYDLVRNQVKAADREPDLRSEDVGDVQKTEAA